MKNSSALDAGVPRRVVLKLTLFVYIQNINCRFFITSYNLFSMGSNNLSNTGEFYLV